MDELGGDSIPETLADAFELLILWVFSFVGAFKLVEKFVIFGSELTGKQSQHFLTFLPLRCRFSVGRFRSKVLALPGFGYFSFEHARSFHDNRKIF